MKTTGWILTILGVAAAGTGVYFYVDNKKKKAQQKALEEQEQKKYIETASAQAAAADLWDGLCNSQTLALQKKINTLYNSGSLSGWEWLDDIKSSVMDYAGKAVDYANSLVKTAKAEAYGPMGFDEFKAAVASIMPLKEDGLYGPKTTAAVKALQVYLNANGARLKEDGLYGDNTDKATGWGIKSLSGIHGAAKVVIK